MRTRKPVVEKKQAKGIEPYAQIVKNARKDEDTSIRDTLGLILQILDYQDKSIKILTDKISELEINIKKPISSKKK